MHCNPRWGYHESYSWFWVQLMSRISYENSYTGIFSLCRRWGWPIALLYMWSAAWLSLACFVKPALRHRTHTQIRWSWDRRSTHCPRFQLLKTLVIDWQSGLSLACVIVLVAYLTDGYTTPTEENHQPWPLRFEEYICHWISWGSNGTPSNYPLLPVFFNLSLSWKAGLFPVASFSLSFCTRRLSD